MNKKQKASLWIGIGLIGVQILFPPWTSSLGNLGYRFIFHSTILDETIDWSRLIGPVVLVAVLTGAALITLRGSKERQR